MEGSSTDMEPEQLLDILGNHNRRKILQLLASRPCYMSEIAERLDVGAKAVLGHLELLENAGLIEGNVDKQRRKYFHIIDNLHLEVSVSPYSYEMETVAIEFRDVPLSQHNKSESAVANLKKQYRDIQRLLEHRQRVLQEYQEIQATITETMGPFMEAIEEVAEDYVEAEILYALLKGPVDKRGLSIQLGIPEYVLEEYLERMKSKKIIEYIDNRYCID